MHGGGSLKRVIYEKRNFSLALWLNAFNRIKESSKTTLSSALYMFSLPWKRNYQQHLKVERQKVSKSQWYPEPEVVNQIRRDSFIYVFRKT